MTNQETKSLVLGTLDAFNELKRCQYLLDFFWDLEEKLFPILIFEIDQTKRGEAFDRLSYIIDLYEKQTQKSLSSLEYSLFELENCIKRN